MLLAWLYPLCDSYAQVFHKRCSKYGGALFPSEKLLTTRVRCLISRFDRSIMLVRMLLWCLFVNSGKGMSSFPNAPRASS